MRKTFEDALNDLIAEYEDAPWEEIVSAMELAAMELAIMADEENEGEDE